MVTGQLECGGQGGDVQHLQHEPDGGGLPGNRQGGHHQPPAQVQGHSHQVPSSRP